MKSIQDFFEAKKLGRKILMLTCYDAQMARLLEEAGTDVLLVGDSLGNVFQGKGSTSEVTLDQMVYHTAAVSRGSSDTIVVTDMPIGTYNTPETAQKNASILIRNGASGVKIEGYQEGIPRSLCTAGIPVMGHLGLLPQTAGEFKVQGRDEDQAEQIFREALALETEGCFAIVLECVPESLGKRITSSLKIPVIGIGAGAFTDGQVLVINDLIGFSRGKKAKFVPTKYTDLGQNLIDVVKSLKDDVISKRYPSDKETYH